MPPTLEQHRNGFELLRDAAGVWLVAHCDGVAIPVRMFADYETETVQRLQALIEAQETPCHATTSGHGHRKRPQKSDPDSAAGVA